jgi:hypothetical protein
MSRRRHEAAMAMFRLLGCGCHLALKETGEGGHGVMVNLTPDTPRELFEAGGPHAPAIMRLLRLRMAEEPHLQPARAKAR